MTEQSIAGRQVGLIGLGAMGSGMAGSLRRAGADVHVCDACEGVAAAFAAQGGTPCTTPAELDSLHGKIDPQFLLRVMVETKRRYDADPAGATRLVDDLVVDGQ